MAEPTLKIRAQRGGVRRRLAAGLTLGALTATAALVSAPGAVGAPDVSGARVSGILGAAARPGAGPAYKNAKLPVPQRVADLLKRMTLEEKVGQMTQAERASIDADATLIGTWNLGSVLSGGGSTPATNDPVAWADMIDRYQAEALKTRLGIPLIYGVDSVHGHGNLTGATIFPHEVGLGATRDPKVVEAGAHVTASETRATGIPWVFAPCLCVVRDDRWGRSYESFGEDPALVTAMETAIDGYQGTRPSDLRKADRVLATAKHFAADGDTTYGSGLDSAGASSSNYPIDQGITQQSQEHVAKIDLGPYVAAVQAHNVGSLMPSYSSMDYTDDGLGNPLKMHAHKPLIQDWLKDTVGFDGFVISDYNGIHQIPPKSDDSPTAEQVRLSVNAGIDMAMEPADYQKFETRLIAEVEAGRVTQDRIDDAVGRILTKKFELGLFENPWADRSNMGDIGSAKHRKVAREAAAKSQVLLKNDQDALPLAKDAKVYVAGRNADNLGNQEGGWTITWQGQMGEHTPGTTILEGIREVAPHAEITHSADASAPMAGSDVGVVVVGETPYAEGFGDVGGPLWAYDPSDNNVPREPKSLTLRAEDKAVVDKVCSAIETCVVLVVSGRTQVITDEVPEADAVVASWLPGSEGAGVADVLFGKQPFTGQLPVSWPRSEDQQPINVGDADYAPLYPFGWGLTTGRDKAANVDASVLSEARAAVAGPARTTQGTGELVRAVRLHVQDAVAHPETGVPATAADAIARADIAHLKGDDRAALTLLLGAL